MYNRKVFFKKNKINSFYMVGSNKSVYILIFNKTCRILSRFKQAFIPNRKLKSQQYADCVA